MWVSYFWMGSWHVNVMKKETYCKVQWHWKYNLILYFFTNKKFIFTKSVIFLKSYISGRPGACNIFIGLTGHQMETLICIYEIKWKLQKKWYVLKVPESVYIQIPNPVILVTESLLARFHWCVVTHLYIWLSFDCSSGETVNAPQVSGRRKNIYAH